MIMKVYSQSSNQLGNVYDVKINIAHIDGNPKKGEELRVGENIYYVDYTTQVEDLLYNTTGTDKIVLSKGDLVYTSAENIDETLYQVFKKFIYKVTGSSAEITGEYAILVLEDGQATQATY